LADSVGERVIDPVGEKRRCLPSGTTRVRYRWCGGLIFSSSSQKTLG
jgi:hypothetical protein